MNKKSKDYYNRVTKLKRIEDINKVFKYYGNFCACCGEKNRLFLTIDHMNNDGAHHRLERGKKDIYLWLIENNYPKGFQILCFNCNLGKSRNKGICPHKEV